MIFIKSVQKNIIITDMKYKDFYTEITNSSPPQSSVDQLFSKILKQTFKSSIGLTDKKKIQEWIDEQLPIPLVMDLKNGKMEAYTSYMKPHIIELTSDYNDVTNFIMNMKLIGIDKNYRYLLISPEMIIEYLFGGAHQYNIPEWST